MTLKKNDFIEIEFTGKTKEGEVFDSNVKEELEKLNPEAAKNTKPFIFALGNKMFLKGVDDFLIGKEIGKYEIEVKPEVAFGQRDTKLIQMIPLRIFKEHNINPVQGAVFNFDGKLAKVLTVSGGRITVDFNHPLAGKEVIYEVNVKKKIKDINEKIKALNEFLFRQDLKYDLKDKKLILKVNPQIKQFVEMFKDKYKEILELGLEVEEEKKKNNYLK